MRAPMALRLLLALALLLGAGRAAAAQTGLRPPDADQPLHRAPAGPGAQAGTPPRSGCLGGGRRRTLEEFVRAMTPAPTALVIKERDRTPLPDGGQRLLLEIFAARGIEARVFTWQMDVHRSRRGGAPPTGSWRVARLDRLSIVSGPLPALASTSRSSSTSATSR